MQKSSCEIQERKAVKLSLMEKLKRNIESLKQNNKISKSTSNVKGKSKEKVHYNKISDNVGVVNADAPERKVKTYSSYSVKPKTTISCRRTSEIGPRSTPKKPAKKKQNLRQSKSLNDVQTKQSKTNLLSKKIDNFSQTALDDICNETFSVKEENCTSEYCSQSSLTSTNDSSTQYDLDQTLDGNRTVSTQCSISTPPNNELIVIDKKDLEDLLHKVFDEYLTTIGERRRCCRRSYSNAKSYVNQSVQTSYQPQDRFDKIPLRYVTRKPTIACLEESICSFYEYPSFADDHYAWDDEFLITENTKETKYYDSLIERFHQLENHYEKSHQRFIKCIDSYTDKLKIIHGDLRDMEEILYDMKYLYYC